MKIQFVFCTLIAFVRTSEDFDLPVSDGFGAAADPLDASDAFSARQGPRFTEEVASESPKAPPVDEGHVLQHVQHCIPTSEVPKSPDSRDYKGCVSTTVSGRQCDAWNVTLAMYNVKKGDNYCRNPFRHRHLWCYVDGKVEECRHSVTCDKHCASPNDCLWPTCVDGECSFILREDGTLCNDGNPDTVDDVCKSGLCKGNQVCAVDKCQNKITKQDAQCRTAIACKDALCHFKYEPDGSNCTITTKAESQGVCKRGTCYPETLCGDQSCVESACKVATCEDGKCVMTNKPDNVYCNEDPNFRAPSGVCKGGVCQWLCKGRDDGCGIKLTLGDGNCRTTSDCQDGLICGKFGSCYDFHQAEGWPKYKELGFDQKDRCCIEPPKEFLPMTVTQKCTCDQKCGAHDLGNGCQCSCRDDCVFSGEVECCDDFYDHCADFTIQTQCSCQENCGKEDILPCGCSCASNCGFHHYPCCNDYTVACVQDGLAVAQAVDTTCSCREERCGKRHSQCGCLCDVACGRCHSLSADDLQKANCHLCCSDPEEVCSEEERGPVACTCQDSCDSPLPAACNLCYCDDECHVHNDCCEDKRAFCGDEALWPEPNEEAPVVVQITKKERRERRLAKFQINEEETSLQLPLLLIVFVAVVAFVIYSRKKFHKQ